MKKEFLTLYSLFYNIVCSTIFQNSSIIKRSEYFSQTLEWFGPFGGKEFTWKRCYRASKSGWYAKDFHSKCDKKNPTVVLVKVDNFIFGGFTDTSWKQDKIGMSHLRYI